MQHGSFTSTLIALVLTTVSCVMHDGAGTSPSYGYSTNGAAAGNVGAAVFINGVQLDEGTRQQLGIPGGRYWYDRMSGAWGYEGGPTLGFTGAGLTLGGELRPDASRGNTGVFINGRELPAADLAALQQLVRRPVMPGRYWVDAQGYAGYEGGPPLVNLRQLAASSGGGAGYYHRGPGGTIGSDGSCSYYNDPETGSSVMTGNC